MPTAANITVKKADGTTDILYTLVSASGGDNSPAVWHSLSSAYMRGHRHTFTMTSRWNGDKTRRRFDIKGSFPYVDGAGVITVQNFELTTSIPQNITDADINENAAQFVNLVASALAKSSLQAGFAPT